MVQTAVCVLEAADGTAASHHPPTNHHHTLTPSLFTRSQEICRNPAGSPRGDQHLGLGRRCRALNAPAATEDACCVSVLLVRLHL